MKSVIICSSKFIFCLLKVTRIWREPLRKYTFADKHIEDILSDAIPTQPTSNAVPCSRVEGGERTIIIFCSHKIDFVCRQLLRSEPQTTLFTPDYRIQSQFQSNTALPHMGTIGCEVVVHRIWARRRLHSQLDYSGKYAYLWTLY